MKNVVRRGLASAAFAAFCLAAAHPAAAQTPVTFSGIVVNSCVLLLSTPGSLDARGGNQLVSTVPALLVVTATGGTPTVAFTAPTLATRPSGYTGTPTVEMAYTSLSGANQAFTPGASQYTGGFLLDTYTINARVTDDEGFTSGTYGVESTATCQQRP